MKETLIQEICELLDSSPRSSIVPIVQKTTRLAAITDQEEYRLLFDLHLDGIDLERRETAHKKWPDSSRKPKWDPITAFFEDRRVTGDRSQSLPLAQLEEVAKDLRKVIDTSPSGATQTTFDRLKESEIILNRITIRVNAFMQEILSGEGSDPRKGHIATKVFIGHGRSRIWRELKDFLEERLGLETDEFNRESTAGKTTIERLNEMLHSAKFAFLVFTAEDEHSDETLHARENVVHEAGLFQGVLGFHRAIILLEDGCNEFSNIHGLTEIRFPKGSILAKSEEIRRVMERERIV